MKVKYSDKLCLVDNQHPFFAKLEYIHGDKAIRSTAFEHCENICLNLVLPSNIIYKSIIFKIC